MKVCPLRFDTEPLVVSVVRLLVCVSDVSALNEAVYASNLSISVIDISASAMEEAATVLDNECQCSFRARSVLD